MTINSADFCCAWSARLAQVYKTIKTKNKLANKEYMCEYLWQLLNATLFHLVNKYIYHLLGIRFENLANLDLPYNYF